MNEVKVRDIDMPFLSMVGFMVKWALASIPAFLVLFLLSMMFWSILIMFGIMR